MEAVLPLSMEACFLPLDIRVRAHDPGPTNRISH